MQFLYSTYPLGRHNVFLSELDESLRILHALQEFFKLFFDILRQSRVKKMHF